MAENVIEARQLSFAYNGQKVLEEVDFDIPAGDFVAVIGPNGGGKTTLLKLMLGLLTPTHGAVRVFGRPPRQVSQRIGYVPQHVETDFRFPISVLDVVLMGRLRPGAKWPWPSRADRCTALETLTRMGVDHLAQRRISDLSGGQRQRVFIARALCAQPEILFLDEPTAGIDPQGQMEMYCLLEQLNATLTIVLVSHD
ncbi:MAG: ABC transporter ATP-binding protein, partial [Desulfatitalea sp.]|nr:ABC transporter ATP-binding protein [Desulfatitalea sp.]